MISATRYSTEMQLQWDQFVVSARNSTLLHLRSYMDYHSDRFEDLSLVFMDEHNKIVALFPACRSMKDNSVVVSHEGLTYGGFVTSSKLYTSELAEIFNLTLNYYRNTLGLSHLLIKPIPHIYASHPSEEQLYLISQNGGTLQHRALSQAICLESPLPFNQLRKRCVIKAMKNGIQVCRTSKESDWREFHALLTEVLDKRHQTSPVHTADELWYLHSQLPDSIHLLTARKNDTLVAGVVTYNSPKVVHTQYLASNPEGQANGALDLLIAQLLQESAKGPQAYLDFGVSTERDGSINSGLTFQKEGFGARGICYDTYSIKL